MGCQAGYTPANITYPSQLINLTNWKLTLPLGPSEDPTEIQQPALATYTNLPYFGLNKYKNAVLFRAHCGGTTTSGSDYPRSELREMTNDGADEAEWDMSSGSHSMLIDQVITKSPPNKREVVAGQIHGGGDDVIRCMFNEGEYGISWDDGNEWTQLDPAYVMGRRFKLYVKAYSGGIDVKYGVTGQATVGVHIPVAVDNCYFKAGCYTISNPSFDSASAYGEVGIYDLQIRHW